MTSESNVLGHGFSDVLLLEQALTHRSAGRRNNERLEFLGDALLNLIVAECIYELFPKASEGDLTRLRASLVNGTALAEMAREEDIGDSLRLGPGELKTGGFRRDSILADTFEALIAAIYLDSGWSSCREHVRRLFASRLDTADAKISKDAKTSLQELLQANGLALPGYELVNTLGDDHDKEFEVKCTIDSLGLAAMGRGTSRRAAEQSAADSILIDTRTAIATKSKNKA